MKSLLVPTAVLFTELCMAGPRLGPLRDEDIEYGCGCSFQLPSVGEHKPKILLQWELGGPANIRVNGRLHKLKVEEIRNDRLSEKPWKVGDRAKFSFQGNDVSGKASCTVIKVCKPDQPSCEVTYFSGVLTVRTSNGTSTSRINATCGC